MEHGGKVPMKILYTEIIQPCSLLLFLRAEEGCRYFSGDRWGLVVCFLLRVRQIEPTQNSVSWWGLWDSRFYFSKVGCAEGTCKCQSGEGSALWHSHSCFFIHLAQVWTWGEVPGCRPGGVRGLDDCSIYRPSAKATVPPLQPTGSSRPPSHVPAASPSGSSLATGRRGTPTSTTPHLLLSHKAHFPWLCSQHSLNPTVLLSSLIICGLSSPVIFFLTGLYHFTVFILMESEGGSGVKYERHPTIMVKSITSGAKYPGFKRLLCYLQLCDSDN